MSDHWNSLANQLGTPSLSPQVKKNSETPKQKPKETSAPEVLEPQPDKPVREVSRLKSGWDAVTAFFGVERNPAPEQPAPPVPEVAKTPSKPSKPSVEASPKAKKSKPSFWDEPEDEVVSEPVAPSSKSDLEQPSMEPNVSFGGRRRDRNPRDRNERPAAEPKEPSPSRSDENRDDEEIVVERRSVRQAPRRGRGMGSSEPNREDVSAEPRQRERRDDRRPRSERPTRGDERPARTGRSDERPARFESDASEPVRDADRSIEPRKPREPREPRRGRSKPSRPVDEQPTRPERVQRSGFASGLDAFDDVPDDDITSPSDSILVSDSELEPVERTDKRRGNRRRGGRSRSKDAEDASAPTDEALDGQDSLKKLSKIPSWADSLAGMIEKNMENHQRSSHGRGDRGRHRGNRSGDRSDR